MSDTKALTTDVATVEPAAPARGVRPWIVAVIAIVALVVGVLIGNSVESGHDGR